MADWGVGSSLRRLCAPTGALVALCLAFAVPATAATPSPDPPPLPAPPKTEPVQPTVTVVVQQAPVVTPAPVVPRAAPAAKAPVQRAKPKPAPAKVIPVVKAKAKKQLTPVARPPHDRNRVPLAAFVATPSADSFDRDLLALAGFGLLLVAIGGAVVLFAARRQLQGLAA